MTKLRVLELYSGIGGMHYALRNLEGLGPFSEFGVVAAIDINTVANEVYQSNFRTTVLNRQIQSLSVKEMDGTLACDLLTMSPPCQPFTRQGKQMGERDPRTQSFLHLLEVLPQLKSKPKMILLENVKGFESSPVCKKYLECLEKCDFVYMQCLLSPVQFGVPNSRLRYYCLAVQNTLLRDEYKDKFSVDESSIVQDPSCFFLSSDIPPVKTIGEFLREIKTDDFLLDDDVLRKNSMVLDIVFPSSTNSCCFTKNYGRYMKGTGSAITESSKEQIDEAYSTPEETRLAAIKGLKLRLFSPEDIASLMCFPPSFRFPETSTLKERYHLLAVLDTPVHGFRHLHTNLPPWANKTHIVGFRCRVFPRSYREPIFCADLCRVANAACIWGVCRCKKDHYQASPIQCLEDSGSVPVLLYVGSLLTWSVFVVIIAAYFETAYDSLGFTEEAAVKRQSRKTKSGSTKTSKMGRVISFEAEEPLEFEYNWAYGGEPEVMEMRMIADEYFAMKS